MESVVRFARFLGRRARFVVWALARLRVAGARYASRGRARTPRHFRSGVVDRVVRDLCARQPSLRNGQGPIRLPLAVQMAGPVDRVHRGDRRTLRRGDRLGAVRPRGAEGRQPRSVALCDHESRRVGVVHARRLHLCRRAADRGVVLPRTPARTARRAVGRRRRHRLDGGRLRGRPHRQRPGRRRRAVGPHGRRGGSCSASSAT